MRNLGIARLVMVVALLSLLVIPARAAWDEFLVLTTDFSTLGEAVVMERFSPWTATVATTVSSDPVGRYHDGLYYVVNRGGASNLQILDPDQGYQTIRQFSLGAGRNPQDIAFRSDGMAFVSCYDAALLLKVDTGSGTILDTFSTAAFADADGLPENGWMQAVDDLLYVTCQRLDSYNYYVPTGLSLLAIFDMALEIWVDVDPGTPELDGIVLTGESPYTQMELTSDRLHLRVGCNGSYFVLDGGVEIVDLAARVSLGYEVTEATLGGDLLDFETVDDTLAYVAVSDLSFHTSVRSYNPTTGGDVVVVAAAAEYAYVDVAYDGGNQLYVCDRSLAAPGLRVFDAGTGQELTAQPVNTGLPPFLVVLPLDEALTSAPPSLAANLTLEAPWPNPANPGTSIGLSGPAGRTVLLGIYDLRGRRVRTARVPLDAGGTGRFFFDGFDDSGRSVASGSYRVIVGTGNQRLGRGLTVVR